MSQQIQVLVLLFLASYVVACASKPLAPSVTPVSQHPAVLSLVASAQAATTAGNLESASATLERALRIEGRNPYLWHELAQIRLQQGQHQQAAGLAAKSNAWAGGDNALRARNWRVIGEVRARSGDWEGAQNAFNKAEALQ